MAPSPCGWTEPVASLAGVGACGWTKPAPMLLPQDLDDSTRVSINVEDVNDNSPVFSQAEYTVTLAEDEATSTVVADVDATDKDSRANGRILYSITGGDPYSQFAVDFATGVVTLAKKLDYENSTSHTIVVTATDQGNPAKSATVDVVLTVTDENDNPPVLSQDVYEMTVTEAASFSDVVGKVEATDADSGINAEVSFILRDSNLQPSEKFT